MERHIETSYLTVPNSLVYLPAIQSYAENIAEVIGFQKSEIQMTLLALEEAVVNVVKHAFEPDEKATYQVIFDPLSSGLRIIIKDKGLPFAPNLLSEYVAPRDVEDAASGLGSFLMRKSVDEVAYHNLGRDGKELHLTKYLPAKSITEYQDSSEMTLFQKPSAKESLPAEKKEYLIRLMEPSESLEVSRLFYRAYGYSYGIDSIYYPDRFEQLHRDGSIISVVTVIDDNKIVGHFALVKEDPQSKIAEAAMAVVQPDFRGQGCQNQMMARLMEEARRAGLLAVFSKAVTNHIYAQKAGEKAGFKRVAIIVALIPADRSFKGIQSELSQRESVAYGFFTIANPPGISVYPPRHHKGFIEGIYRNLGLDRIFKEAEEEAPAADEEEACLVKTKIIATYNRAIIEVERYGDNVVSEVRSTLKDLCLKRIDQITLYLSLEDPRTGRMCAEFEKLGFFIAGILPFSHVGDALILQYLNNVPMDYSKIQVASDTAREILDYIKAGDPNVS
jgi:anti-sigma regulatory factor (Ser/Thr protein kinase)/N-acetylglutamate synthase-like GNAT family acetyltransferase